MVANTLVDAFVVACEDDEVALEGEFVGDVLVESFAVGRGEDDLIVVALGLQGGGDGCAPWPDPIPIHGFSPHYR